MKKKCNIFFLLLVFSFSLTITAQQFTTGLDFSREKYQEIPKTVPILSRSFNRLPSSFSIKAFCPTPKSQGQQPSCTGWASGYAARTIAYAITNNWEGQTSVINQNTFSPSFVYNLIKAEGDINCKRGSFIEDAMKLMNSYGVLKFTDFTYDFTNCQKKPSEYGYQLAKNNKILTFERLADYDNPANLTEKIKKAISNKNPVVIGMKVFNSFYKAKGVWNGNTAGPLGGHAMVIVGYDDTKYGGAFEIMNSWGSTWGNQGFIWVTYDDFKIHGKTAYVLIDRPASPDNNNNNDNNSNVIAGEITLKLGNGKNMGTTLSSGASRNFSIVKASKTTYRVNETYTSGTQFRIYLNSKQRGYVYLIGYGSSDKSVHKLYPFENFSDFFNYTNSEIAIPNEDYFIEFDNNPGRDILCVLYSKEKLNIDDIVNKSKSGSGDFVSKVKGALQGKIFDGKDVTFSKDKVAFSTATNNTNASVVPIFIEVNHQ